MTSAAGTDVWARTWIGWDVVLYAGTASLAATAYADDDLTGDRGLVVVALLALAAWYAVTGAPAMRTRSVPLALAYLAGMIPLFLVAFAQYGVLGLLLFILYSQCWALLDSPALSAVAVTVLTAGISGVALAVFGSPPWLVLTQAAVSLGFTLLLGLWIGRIVEQSAERRTVIDELEAARAELAAAHHQAGVLAERERMAREIHDTLAQGFTSVVMLLELAESEIADEPAAARRRLAAARDTARQNLAEARALVAALTPVDLQSAPLPEALGRLVDRYGRETGRPAALTVSGPARPLPANEEVVLLRAAQEALANTRKHAGACAVTVALRYGPDGAALAVTDDGPGFDPAAATGGYGLAGMRRRAEEVGGTVAVRSGPAGTTVEVRCSG